MFAWWLPAFAVFALEEARAGEGLSATAFGRSEVPVLAGVGSRSFCPTLVLLASVDRDGRPYAAVLRRSGVSAEPEARGVRRPSGSCTT